MFSHANEKATALDQFKQKNSYFGEKLKSCREETGVSKKSIFQLVWWYDRPSSRNILYI